MPLHLSLLHGRSLELSRSVWTPHSCTHSHVQFPWPCTKSCSSVGSDDTLLCCCSPLPASSCADQRNLTDAVISILTCAELALAAAQLEPPAGSAASRHMDNPRLLEQALQLAEAAQLGVVNALDTAGWPVHQVWRSSGGAFRS
jgi:hypothetical protein